MALERCLLPRELGDESAGVCFGLAERPLYDALTFAGGEVRVTAICANSLFFSLVYCPLASVDTRS
jgi:hypothetical protein